MNNGEASELLWHLVRLKFLDLGHIIRSYAGAKKDYLERTEALTSGNLQESEISIQFQRLRDSRQLLWFYYQDFFIHAIILCDLIARAVSKNRFSKFHELVRNIKDNPATLYAKAIVGFEPFEKKMRYWRNKLHVHYEIAALGGGVRSHPRGDVEFSLRTQTKIEEQDLKYLYQVRVKYSQSYRYLQKENNFWELLSLFDRLPISLDKTEERTFHDFRKKYGTFLPQIEDFATAVITLITELGLR